MAITLEALAIKHWHRREDEVMSRSFEKDGEPRSGAVLEERGRSGGMGPRAP